ncbi:MAG: hypothetical protein GF307_08320 [candidate division Zixibacteria bacterium]|nr:hypothetical protein [candidate division Zixibacteria bacterium]
MRTTFYIITSAALAILTFGCGGGSSSNGPAPADFYVSLTPQNDTVDIDSSTTLTGSINEVSNLFAITFDLLFDTSLVKVDTVMVPADGIWGSGSGLVFFQRNHDGISIGLGKVQTEGNDNVSGSGEFFTIDFTGNSAGSAQIVYDDISIVDENGTSNSNINNLQTKSAQIVVQ